MSGLLTAEQRRQLDRLLAERMPERQVPTIPRWEGDRSAMPLSYAQQRIWFFSQLDPTSPLYNVVGTVRLTGPLDLSAVQAALDEIVRRHEVLRTNYLLSGGQPVQVVRAAEPAPITVVDLSEVHPADRDAEIAERCRREASRPFDLANDLMVRPVFLQLGPQDHLLLVSQHHIAADGWSLGVLMTEFTELYRAFRDGEPSPLAEPALQYGDFAQWQRESLRTRLDSQLSYWTGNLAGARPLDLPGDRVPPETLGWAGQSVRFSYDAEFVASLHRLAAEATPSTRQQTDGRSRRDPGARATLFMVLTAAFAVVASRWSGQSDFVVGTPIANRNEPAIEPMLGCFVNTLPLRLAPNQAAGFGELLAAVRTTCLNGYANQDVPFERIVEAVSPERDARSRTPLVRQMIGLHNTAQRELALPGVRAELGVVNTGLARFDLEWEFTPRPDGGLGGELRFTTDLFSAELAGRIVEAMRAVLTAAVAAPDEPIGRYQLTTPAERLRVTEGFLSPEPPTEPDPVEQCRQIAAEDPTLAGLLADEQRLRRASSAFIRWTAALGPASAEDVLVCSRPDSAADATALGWLLRALAAGATVVERPPSATGRQLLELVAGTGVTGCLLGSGLLDELLRDPELLGRLAEGPLRQLICPDTGLSDRLAQRLGQALPEVRIHAVYLRPDADGPLTACQPATVPDRRPVLLGRPLPGVRLRLLDGCGQLVPVGVPGELSIDAASGTGDLARWLPDGNLEHLGPVADAGRRRETVRRALLGVPVVGQAAVRSRADGSMAGYVSLVEPDGGLAASRRDFLTGYASRAADRDPAAHLTGWNSPFTGDYVPAEQMREWLNGTVTRIRQQQPEHVLQIGCTSVALPSALAPHCASYRVVDPSIRQLEQLRREHPDIQLLEHPADDLAGLPAVAGFPVDTVLIGISQFFPDARYLRAVLSDAVGLVGPGGRVLLLDVRNLTLLAEQHAVGLLRSLPDDAPVTELLRLADGLAEQDELLAVDPDQLVAFARGLPGAGSVAVLPKLTQHANEVTRFRYDLLIQLGSADGQADCAPSAEAGLPAPVVLAAARSCSTVGELRAAVESGAAPAAELANPFAGALTNSPAAARLARTTAPRIQRQLRDRLPGSLLPGSITAVRHWPLTAAGAVDPDRLPEPLQSAELTARPIPARTDTERTVAEIWQSVLEVTEIGVNQDFFALGGHSLLGTQVIDAIQTRFDVELPLARLFESSTIAAVADFIDEQQRSPERTAPIRRIDRSAFRRPAGNRGSDG